jgi:hypothetical protein
VSAALEEDLGGRLFQNTTQSSSITEEGGCRARFLKEWARASVEAAGANGARRACGGFGWWGQLHAVIA